jgi:hypothetical protein
MPRVFLDEMIGCLREYVQEMKAELVFNLDEVGMSVCRYAGMSEWEDRKNKKVIVPKTMDSQMIYHRGS